ncbi:MAG: SCO family protein [Oscillochloridaceae bacterium umkhey_bin13]
MVWRERYRCSWFILVLLLVVLASPSLALAQGGHDPLSKVSFEQHLGHQIPLDLTFVDETGATVTLGSYFGDKPVLLSLNYYTCPMLCSLVRDGMVRGLEDVRLTVGQEFVVVNVSIDPSETPMQAANAKAAMVSRYNRPGSEAGWHFLTGPQDSIAQLAEAVGFRYFYDETIGQYAHAAGILILTPEGKLARYFYGIEYNPSDLRLSLVEASGNRIGSAVDQLLLLCYHFDPSTGRYTGLVMTLTRVAGAITVLTMALAIFWLHRSSLRPGPPSGPAPVAG